MFQTCPPCCTVTPGTDRSNIVQTPGPNDNYPIPWDKNSDGNMFGDAEVLWSSFAGNGAVESEDLAVAMASAGYYHCRTGCGAESVETKEPMNQLLNNAPASFEGALLRFRTRGTYYYICSRNNNFTNRSQKGQIIVTEAS